MEKTVDERLDAIEDKLFVFGLAIKFALAKASPTNAGRAEMREDLCGALERHFERQSLTPEAGPRVQRMLAEMEALFPLAQPKADPHSR